MGCDIHSMYERNHRIGNRIDLDFPWWHNMGDPEIDRNYQLFGMLAGVRRDPPEGPVSFPKFDKGDLDWKDPEFDEECRELLDGQFSDPFCSWLQCWWPDAHSVSYLTLSELRAYERYRFPKMKDWLERETLRRWDKILSDLEFLRREKDLTLDEVRIAFFFDN